ncbi:MAG: UDP-N-acetylglucosamine 2-epimerase [candidate division KSB1 bacterium]
MNATCTVIVLENLTQLEQLQIEPNAVFYSDDAAVQRELARRQLHHASLAQLLSATELEEINARAAQWHAQWLTSTPDFFFHELPIATGLIQFYEPWARVLRRIRVYRAVLQKFEPARLRASAEEELLLRQLLVCFPNVALIIAPRTTTARKKNWFLERMRYRGGLRKALRFYLDYWWNETPLGKGRMRVEETPAGYVLFCAGYVNHAKTFLPILGALQTPSLMLALSPEPCDYFRQRQIPFRRLGHFVTSAMRQRFRAQQRWIKQNEEQLTRTLQEFHYEGVALAPLLQADLRRLLRHQLARLRLYAEAYLNLLRQTRPSHVVVADDTTTHGRVLVLAAQSLGIPTLNIQHGAIADVQQYRHALADRMAVWGEHDRALLARNGVPESRIVITGQPRFDAAVKVDDARAVRRALKLPLTHKLLLWATTPYVARLAYDFPERNQRYLETLLALVEREQDWVLLIKLHPVDQRPAYAQLLNKINASVRQRVRLYQQEDIQELLFVAEVVLAWNTSVMQEAALLHKPMVGMNFFGFPESIPSVSAGIALSATNSEELAQALRQIFRNEANTLELLTQKRSEYVKHYLNVTGQQSAVARILQLLASHRSS